MNTCFNCGTRYIDYDMPNKFNTDDDPKNYQGFCSLQCKIEDDARLVEGNGIIEAAEKAELGFTDINKLKLDTNMPLAAKALQELKSKNEQNKQQLNNLLGFNRQNRSDANDNEDKDSL